eukprot:6055365-Prymnesium_polylepis.1
MMKKFGAEASSQAAAAPQTAQSNRAARCIQGRRRGTRARHAQPQPPRPRQNGRHACDAPPARHRPPRAAADP